MNKQTSKTLAYCGITNITDIGYGEYLFTDSTGYTHQGELPDFTTGNGWELLSAKIVENKGWDKFFDWYNPTGNLHNRTAFHEYKPPAEKSQLFSEYLGRK